MAFTYTTIDGERVETAVARAYAQMEAEFQRVFGLDLIVSSGTRTRAEQAYLYDGWIERLPGFNLAAPPGQSNHEETGPRGPRALDLRDTGGDSGVTVIGSARSNWLAANCGRWGFTNAGHYFSPREGWHYEYTGALGGGGGGGDWPARERYGEQWVRSIQEKANRLGGNLEVDGKDGPATQSWVKAFQSANGLEVDGIPGPDTNTKIDAVLAGNAKLNVDGELGPLTVCRMQVAFGVTADGDWGPNTTSAIQKHLGVPVDGQLGPVTIKALQRALKVSADGEIGPETIKALQTWLNTGGFLVPVPAPAEAEEPEKPAASPRTPVYPKAVRGWNVPLSSDRPAGQKIDRLIVHHQGSTNDDENYFKTRNSRGSCPTWQVKKDGTVVELIAPNKKPSSTGSANSRSVAIETQNTTMAPNWGISAESHEAIAQLAAWCSQQSNMDIKLDRTHVIGHNEAGVNATACPGPSMDLDWIVARAKEIVSPVPQPEPGKPGLVQEVKEAYTELGTLINQLEES